MDPRSDLLQVALQWLGTRGLLGLFLATFTTVLRPMLVESGRLHLNPPPETRNDLTQYPGALTLNFVPITVNERTFVPVGINAGYSNTIDITWLGAQPPTISVLYRAHAS